MRKLRLVVFVLAAVAALYPLSYVLLRNSNVIYYESRGPDNAEWIGVEYNSDFFVAHPGWAERVMTFYRPLISLEYHLHVEETY